MIRLALYEELLNISELMNDVFEEKMQAKYSKEGKQTFLELISLASLQERFTHQNSFYIFLDEGHIEGVIETENPCHIAFLFSKKEHHGIGTSLCEYALVRTDEEVCTVGAFEDSLGFYLHLGFKKISEAQESQGFSFTLMGRYLS